MTADDGFDVRSLALTLRPGAHIAPHRHAWAQLVYACSGVMRISTDTETWLAPATKAIWLPAMLRHRIDMQGEVTLRTLYVAPERAAPLPTTPEAFEVEPLLREMILHIVRLGMLTPQIPEHGRPAGVLVDLLARARRQDLQLPLPDDPHARAAARRLQDAPANADSLATIAAASGASLRTLQRLFPRETGLTLEAWRQKARLIRSIASLACGDGVTKASLECGYQNVGAFIAAFSRQFGVTPGNYR